MDGLVWERKGML